MSSKFVVVAEYDAKGGPETKGKDAAGNAFGPTPVDDFVIARCGKHHNSQLYKLWSTLAWGTPLREHTGDVEYEDGSKWHSLTRLWNRLRVASRALTTAETTQIILDRYDELYATKLIPPTWVFNDFGHMTCYFFKDLNGDGRLDGKEKLQTQFLHTTPNDEATAARFPTQTIVLSRSHGCIHVKPAAIDDMIKKGYLKRGNHLVVHTYHEAPPVTTVKYGHAPYQVHFFPGVGKIQVRGKQNATSGPHT